MTRKQKYQILGYFTSYKTPEFKEIEGEPVTIPGFKEFHLFIHGEPKKSWTISERLSGCVVVRAYTKQEVIQWAKRILTDIGKRHLARTILLAIKTDRATDFIKTPEGQTYFNLLQKLAEEGGNTK